MLCRRILPKAFFRQRLFNGLRKFSQDHSLIHARSGAKTKIVSTLGPASCNPEILGGMIDAGMDKRKPIAILCDVQGPKIRLGKMKDSVSLHIGHKIKVTPEQIVGDKNRASIQYPTLLEDLTVGDKIFINDGIVQLSVKGKEGNDLVCVVDAAGTISSHKGCNLPTGNINVEVLSEKDKKDLELIAELDPEYVAASFIGNGEDVRKVRRTLHQYGNTGIKIISKIERPVALKNLDDIIKESDGVMVARGDLGVEIPPHQVPAAQKTIIKKCNRAGKPVITATQMLESMTQQPSATRAEASDVFNAVLDGTDAVMLSGETSVGKYPVEAVQFMDNIAKTAETHMPKSNPAEKSSSNPTVVETIGHSTFIQVEQLKDFGKCGAILLFTNSGYTANQVSKFRPSMPIIAFTSSERVSRELNLVWGVMPVYLPSFEGRDMEDKIIRGLRKAAKLGMVDETDHAVVVFSSAQHSGAFMGVYDVNRIISITADNPFE